MLRWGILSAAPIAVTHVIPAIQKSCNGIVAAIASRDRDKAQHIAQRFRVPHVEPTYEDLLSSDQVDAIYIATPSSHHVTWTLKAASQGKHILCEKPIAMTASDIDALIAARDKNKIVISEAFMVRYHPQWQKVRSLLADGAIGNLRHVQGSFSYFKKDPASTRNKPELGGGGLPDIGVYPIVTTRFVSKSEPESISAKINYDPEFKTDRYAIIDAHFANFDLTFYCSTQMALRQSMVFHGENGIIDMRTPFNPPGYGPAEIALHDIHHQSSKLFRFSDVNQYQLQCEGFADAVQGEIVKNRAVRIMSLEESRLNQMVIDAAYHSDHIGASVLI